LTNADLDILAAKIAERLSTPRWMKLSVAANYSGYGMSKLKELATRGSIRGYQDPDSKRGDWVFDKESIDEYRLLPCFSVEQEAIDILRSL